MRQKVIYSVHGDEVHVSYTFEDEPVVHAELQGATAELARKYQFAIKELEVTESYLEQVLITLASYENTLDQLAGTTILKMEKRDEAIAQGLFSAATVAYGKLFMSVGQGRRQFQPREFFSKEGKRFEKLHAWWMDVRNQYIAHSAGAPYDDARVVLLLPPPYVDAPDWFWCFPHVRFHRLPQPKTIEDLTSMTEFMLSLMRAKQERLLKHIAGKLDRATRQTYRLEAVYASRCHDLPSAPDVSE